MSFAISLLKFKRTTIRYMKEMILDKYSNDAIMKARQNREVVLEMINRENTQNEKLEEYEQMAHDDPTLLTMIRTLKQDLQLDASERRCKIIIADFSDITEKKAQTQRKKFMREKKDSNQKKIIKGWDWS